MEWNIPKGVRLNQRISHIDTDSNFAYSGGTLSLVPINN